MLFTAALHRVPLQLDDSNKKTNTDTQTHTHTHTNTQQLDRGPCSIIERKWALQHQGVRPSCASPIWVLKPQYGQTTFQVYPARSYDGAGPQS